MTKQNDTPPLEWVAGKPEASKRPKTGAMKGATGSVIRIPLLLGLMVALLMGSCIGVPALLNLIEDTTAMEFSADFRGVVFQLTLPLAFVGALFYATGRHLIRNWLAERRLGVVTVVANAKGDDGELLELGIRIPKLARAFVRRVVLEAKTTNVEMGDAPAVPEQFADIAEEMELGGGHYDVSWSGQMDVDVQKKTLRDVRVVETFELSEAITWAEKVDMEVKIDIEVGWWADWYATVKVEGRR